MPRKGHDRPRDGVCSWIKPVRGCGQARLQAGLSGQLPLATLNALPGKTLYAQAPQSLPRKGGGACAPPSLDHDAVTPFAC